MFFPSVCPCFLTFPYIFPNFILSAEFCKPAKLSHQEDTMDFLSTHSIPFSYQQLFTCDYDNGRIRTRYINFYILISILKNYKLVGADVRGSILLNMDLPFGSSHPLQVLFTCGISVTNKCTREVSQRFLKGHFVSGVVISFRIHFTPSLFMESGEWLVLILSY